jgi:hypothetical protein
MSDTYRADLASRLIEPDVAISWHAVAAGAVAAASLTLVLLAFGSAVGFSAVSPWSNAGVSIQAFHIATGLYLVVVAMLSSTVGGYISGRLRTKWTGLRPYEIQFRDTAHGFLAWALATVLGAAVLGTAATYFVGGATTIPAPTTSASAAQISPLAAYYVDMLFRQSGNMAPAAASDGALRREAGLIFVHDTVEPDFPAADQRYLAQLVSERTGLNAGDAAKRVSDVIAQAKSAADRARKSAAALSIWMTISMVVGAFAASLAAVEGGQLRDGRWKGVIGARAYQQEAAR